MNAAAAALVHLYEVVIGGLFMLLYAVVLRQATRIQGSRFLCTPNTLTTIGTTALISQFIASVATLAFMRSPAGWQMDQNLSLPFSAAGYMLPGLIAACVAVRFVTRSR